MYYINILYYSYIDTRGIVVIKYLLFYYKIKFVHHITTNIYYSKKFPYQGLQVDFLQNKKYLIG